MRRQTVVIHIVSIIFKYLCFHNAINILEQGGTDTVSIHAAGIVHAGIVAVAEFFICFPFSTASKRRRVCYSRNTGYRAGVCDGGDRIRRHIAIRASACAAERHHDRTLCTNFSIRNCEELDAGRCFNQPSRWYDDPRRACHHDIAAGFLGRQHTQANGSTEVQQRGANRCVHKAAVVDIFQHREQDIEYPCKNAQEQAERASDGQVCRCPKQFSRFMLQSIQQFIVCRAAKAS